MGNPFKIEGPAVISFSGGRTSGFMLMKITEAHGGTLPPNVICIFANTGKEHEKTLEFVEECSKRIAPVVWIEYAGRNEERKKTNRIVDFKTASRNGEPFAKLIEERSYTPNIVARFCTVELKIRPMHRYVRALGWDSWLSCVGIRADEPRRLAKLRARKGSETPDELAFSPLGDAGISKRDVLDYWAAQSWGLDLPISPDGDTWGGNCDLCFLKGLHKKIGLIRENPERAIWWMQQEEKVGGRFRNDQPTYRQLIDIATQPAFDFEGGDIADCACTD